MRIKTIALVTLATLGIFLTTTTNAADLTIINHTKFDSTSIINNGACSTILGEVGTTKAGKTNPVPEKIFRQACFFNKENCVADVYMTNDCWVSGPVIATVTISTTRGIQHVDNKNVNGFSVSGAPGSFVVELNGGPQ